MKQTPFSNWEAARVGLFLSASIALLCLIFWQGSWSITIFGVNAALVVILFGILGGLAGKLLLKTRKGAWMGASLTLVALLWWLYSIASSVPLE